MSTTTAPCNCQSAGDTSTSDTSQRPRYYARQLVTPEDLTLEQEYFRSRLRRHNRLMHGTGVVCGARVVVGSKPWKVLVQPGYVLGPYGDDIWIDSQVCVDVRTRCAATSEPAADDCGCSEAQPAPTLGSVQYLGIRYREVKARLVRVPSGGCGCETQACEFSRYADGYEICVVDGCDSPGAQPPPFEQASSGAPPECPPTPSSPWVVLGAFTVDAEGTITIDQCNCRRQVLGLGSFWWSCGGSEDSVQRANP
jgi:hypothetical protein